MSAQRDDPTSSSTSPRPVLRRQAGQALRVVSSEIFAPQLAQTLITPITSYLFTGSEEGEEPSGRKCPPPHSDPFDVKRFKKIE